MAHGLEGLVTVTQEAVTAPERAAVLAENLPPTLAYNPGSIGTISVSEVVASSDKTWCDGPTADHGADNLQPSNFN